MGRTPYWLIKGGMLIDVLAIPAVALFCYGLYLHWMKIQNGTHHYRLSWENIRFTFNRVRSGRFFLIGFLGSRVYRKPFTGIFHGMVTWGMLLLLFGTISVLLNVMFGISTMSGAFYNWFMAFGLDAAGLAVLIGIGFLLVRRLVGYHRLVEPKARRGFIVIESLLLAVILTGFLVEAQRIGLAKAHETAFVGSLVARFLPSSDIGQSIYTFFWWTHGLLALTFVGYIAFSPLTHLLFIPVNAALTSSIMGADEKALDLSLLEADENGEMPSLGTPTLADYSPKALLDFSTCLWCGRCHEICPATQTEKDLTPKGVMVTLAERLQRGKWSGNDLIDMVGMETIFQCRTCAACVECCPGMVNPLKAMWSMRKNLVMERGEMPVNLIQVYRNMETLLQPFSSLSSASDWRKGLNVPRFKAQETEYLLWVGCAVTYEDRAQKAGRALVHILNYAGVSYGIIEEARCTGDPAKQMGDDYLFSQLANANILLFKELGVKKLITLCPHCYNSFKNYYPPLGGTYQVIPHVSIIKDLIRAGKIQVSHGYQKIAYHDPCYLGRHNKIFNAPRDVLNSVGYSIEMPRNRRNSFCCGAGGGNYWNEESGKRINYARAHEAFETGADKIATACPFCLNMLTDGLKMFTDKEMVFEIAELVEQSLHKRTEKVDRREDLQEVILKQSVK
jgi:Fe-S oxidoreductase